MILEWLGLGVTVFTQDAAENIEAENPGKKNKPKPTNQQQQNQNKPKTKNNPNKKPPHRQKNLPHPLQMCLPKQCMCSSKETLLLNRH